jgi:UDP-N-acetylmuramoylalanine--D-glutamate ligase
MGLGRHGGGVGVARWLAGEGALVTVTDTAGAESLGDSLAALRAAPIAHYRLGEHHADDFSSADLVVVNPAVRPGHPLVALAVARGARVTSEIELFLDRCPATVVGVTGSNGKSTTATMLAAMLRAGGRRVWLGGNIGGSLLRDLPPLGPIPSLDDSKASEDLVSFAGLSSLAARTAIAGSTVADMKNRVRASDVAVVELSSFQLSHLGEQPRWPRLAIVTNCTPNHLDWHGDFKHYAAAKQRLVLGAGADGAVMLGEQLATSSDWTSLVAGRRLEPPIDLLAAARLGVPGEHNRANALAAAAMALELGVSGESIVRAAVAFAGLEHRLQLVVSVDSRLFYNDSKSTSPAAAAAEIGALAEPVWWLAGGDAKGTSFETLAALAVRGARGAAVFGKDRHALAGALRAADASFPLFVTERLAEALAWCWRASSPGDAILLSPAAASLDQFADYADRGRQFARMAKDIGSSAAHEERGE